MGFYNNNTYQNYYDLAASLNYPTVLDFIGSNRTLNDTNLDSSIDYYIYKTVSTDIPTLSIYQQSFKEFKQNNRILKNYDNSSLLNDNVITPYLPFFSNCEIIGSHITFEDLLSFNNCTIKNANVYIIVKLGNFIFFLHKLIFFFNF